MGQLVAKDIGPAGRRDQRVKGEVAGDPQEEDDLRRLHLPDLEELAIKRDPKPDDRGNEPEPQREPRDLGQHGAFKAG